MFAPVFRQLFWKEFRMLWPLWAAVAMLCLFIDLGIASVMNTPNEVAMRNQWFLLVASILPALYGLGSAGTQFAWELESGTFGRLRAFPVSSGKVVWAKLSWTIASALLLGVVLWSGSLLWIGSGQVDDITVTQVFNATVFLRLLNIYGLAACEAIVWGAIVSMLSRSPLMATIIASIFAVLCFCVNVLIGYAIWDFTGSGFGNKGYWRAYEAAWPIRLGLLVVLTAVLVFVGRRWFNYWRARESESAEEPYKFDAEYRLHTSYVQGDGGFLALCQQAWRRNLPFWAVSIFLTIVITVMVLSRMAGGNHSLESGFFAGVAVIGLIVGCTVIASNVFGLDQSDRGFRFFAHHGVRTSTVWLSRVLLSGIFFFVPWIIFIVILWFAASGDGPKFSAAVFDVGLTIGPCMFMAGAFFSVLCQSRVLAWVWTFSATVVCSLVAQFLFVYDVSAFLALLLALGFMVCSYWGVSERIYERSGRRVWGRRIALWSCCTVVFVGLVITQRLASVPKVTIEAKYLADYEQAWKSPTSMQLMNELEVFEGFSSKPVKVDRPAEWLQVKNEGKTGQVDEGDVAEEVQAPSPKQDFDGVMTVFDEQELNQLLRIVNSSKEPDWAELRDCNRGNAKWEELVKNLMHMRHGLFKTAEYYSRLGEPEKSLDCLLATIRLSPPWTEADTATIVFDHLARWSTGPGVTPEVIGKAIRRIEQLPPPSESVQRFMIAEYLYRQETLDQKDLMEKRIDSTHRVLFTLLPWERVRLERILDRSVAEELAVLDYWKQVRGEVRSHPLNELKERILAWNGTQRWRSDDLLRDFYLSYARTMDLDVKIGRLWQAELFRRLALASLAIRAYQLEHDGALPKSMMPTLKYVENSIWLSMPCGPSFEFCPKGLNEKQYVQPGLDIGGFPSYKRPALVGRLSDTPCIILDTPTLYEAYGFPGIGSEKGRDNILGLPDEQFNHISTVYPLPFKEHKQEHEEEEE